jgi:hypothetical protein
MDFEIISWTWSLRQMEQSTDLTYERQRKEPGLRLYLCSSVAMIDGIVSEEHEIPLASD